MDNEQLSQTTPPSEATTPNTNSVIKIWAIVTCCFLLFIGAAYYVLFIQKATIALNPCGLNTQFPTYSVKLKKPIKDIIAQKGPVTPITPFVGAYEGEVKGDWIRLTVFPKDALIPFLSGDYIHYAYQSPQPNQHGFKSATIVDNKLLWKVANDTYTFTESDNGTYSMSVKKSDGEITVPMISCTI